MFVCNKRNLVSLVLLASVFVTGGFAVAGDYVPTINDISAMKKKTLFEREKTKYEEAKEKNQPKKKTTTIKKQKDTELYLIGVGGLEDKLVAEIYLNGVIFSASLDELLPYNFIILDITPTSIQLADENGNSRRAFLSKLPTDTKLKNTTANQNGQYIFPQPPPIPN